MKLMNFRLAMLLVLLCAPVLMIVSAQDAAPADCDAEQRAAIKAILDESYTIPYAVLVLALNNGKLAEGDWYTVMHDASELHQEWNSETAATLPDCQQAAELTTHVNNVLDNLIITTSLGQLYYLFSTGAIEDGGDLQERFEYHIERLSEGNAAYSEFVDIFKS